MTKKIFALMLAAVLMLSALLLASCGNGSESSGASGESSSGDGESSQPARGFLNEEKVWNTDVNVLVYATDSHPFSTIIIPDEMNNEPINDAFYNRNDFIREKYGLNLNLVTRPDPGDVVSLIRTNHESGVKDINVISLPLTYISTLGVEGLLHDFNSVGNEYLHLDQPWWDQSARRDLTLNGKLWFLAGDAIIEDDEATWAMYFNKDLITSYGLENPYELVNTNKWNLDKLYEMCKSVQYGGAMEFDPSANSVWGIVTQCYDCYALMLGANQPMVDTSGEEPKFRVDTEANVAAFEDVMKLMLDSDICGVAEFYGAWNSGVYDKKRQIFAAGKSVFMPGMISVVSGDELRNAEIHYGILPMPKADEFQDDYTTSVQCYWCQVMAVPANVVGTDLEATCYALEAMAYYGMEKVTPEYYNRTLSLKRFPDAESAEMLDLIFRNRTFDLAGIFDFGTVNDNGAGTLYFYTTLLGSKTTDIISNWESRVSSFQYALDDLLTAVSD